jgi:asparagine N-glycosylation enzyme membrane subunit Stt3
MGLVRKKSLRRIYFKKRDMSEVILFLFLVLSIMLALIQSEQKLYSNNYVIFFFFSISFADVYKEKRDTDDHVILHH